MLKWTSESEYFLSFENFFADTIYSKSNHFTPSAAHARRGVITVDFTSNRKMARSVLIIMCAWQECSNCVNALKIIINNPVNVGRFKCSRAPGLHGWPSLLVVPLWQRVLQMTLLHASR